MMPKSGNRFSADIMLSLIEVIRLYAAFTLAQDLASKSGATGVPMTDAVALAQSYAATEAVKAQQALSIEVIKQQAGAEAAVVDLLQQGAEQQKALLPAGQGGNVDITA
jgi:hypothetical protein